MILVDCAGCSRTFGTSACSGSAYCPDCSGETAAKKKEKDRWDALTNEQKIEELLMRVQSLENHQCNPLIG